MANNRYKHDRLVVTKEVLREKNGNRNDTMVLSKGGFSWQIIDTNITDWL